jgi:hypothetical protein
MSLLFSPETVSPDISRRLPPGPGFEEASRSVEAALDELRAAEASLERQLSALRNYLRPTEPPQETQAQAA